MIVGISGIQIHDTHSVLEQFIPEEDHIAEWLYLSQLKYFDYFQQFIPFFTDELVIATKSEEPYFWQKIETELMVNNYIKKSYR